MPRMFFTFNANTFKTNASASNIKFPDTPEAHQIADMLAQKLYNHPAQKPSVDRDQRSSNLSTVFVDKDVAETFWPFITTPPEQMSVQQNIKSQIEDAETQSISQSDLFLQLQVQNPQPTILHSATITSNAQLDARRSSTYISTVNNQFCPKYPILAE